MLVFDNVSKVYPNGIKGLQNINLTINAGEFVAIIGLSGAGKSTLLRSINRLESITTGEIIMPIYSSLSLNHFEIAVRSATTLGLVGAGGIGAPLIFAIQTRSWGKVSIILLGVMSTVFILDIITGILRRKLR